MLPMHSTQRSIIVPIHCGKHSGISSDIEFEPQPVTKAILYARFSPRKDVENCQSIAMQVDLCHKYCERHGYTIVAEPFTDEDVSGDDEDRAGLWNAINSLKRTMVLVAWRADRLARNVYLNEFVYRVVKRRQARIEVVDGSRNGDSAEDILQRQILAVVAEYERKMIAARSKAASLSYQASGIAMSKVPPYGRQEGPTREVVGKNGERRWQRTWIDNPEEMLIIMRIVRERREGHGYREIARRLTADGVPCRGKSWHHTTIAKICNRNRGSK
jgi:DNA invertase Pin-like site-specific DNA recombinase